MASALDNSSLLSIYATLLITNNICFKDCKNTTFKGKNYQILMWLGIRTQSLILGENMTK